jgi:hypothetical protein
VESKSGLPEWVKAIVGIGIAVLVIGYCGGAFTDSPSGVPSVFDPGAPLTSCTSTVIYRVTGTASSASLTISNEQGNTEQEDSVVIPWARRMTFPCGEFVYVSAQNNGESGTIECSISADGQVIESAESSGAFVIADCSGTAP